jgi:hypothetical protein
MKPVAKSITGTCTKNRLESQLVVFMEEFSLFMNKGTVRTSQLKLSVSITVSGKIL